MVDIMAITTDMDTTATTMDTTATTMDTTATTMDTAIIMGSTTDTTMDMGTTDIMVEGHLDSEVQMKMELQTLCRTSFIIKHCQFSINKYHVKIILSTTRF